MHCNQEDCAYGGRSGLGVFLVWAFFTFPICPWCGSLSTRHAYLFLQIFFLLSFHTGQLVVPLVQLNLAGAITFVYAVYKLGNAILTADRSATSLEAFKSTLKTSLFTKLYSWDAQITHS